MKAVKVLFVLAILLGTYQALGQDYCLSFDGSDYVTVPNSPQLFFSGPFTIEAWVTIEGPHSGDHVRILSTLAASASTPHTGWLVGIYEPFDQAFPTNLCGDYFSEFTAPYVPFHSPLDHWKHLAMSYDGSIIRLFNDGRQVYQITYPLQFQTSSNPMTIGGQNGTFGGRNLNGKIDEVRLSSTCRYVGDFIPSNYFVNDPQTMALYHFDEGSGSTLHDASVNAHDGTIYGASWIASSVPPFPPQVIRLTPDPWPMDIPAPGGVVGYNIAAENNSSYIVTQVWCMVTLPDGSSYGPVVGPVQIVLYGGSALNRDRSQDVPANAPAGIYWYNAYIGTYPSSVTDMDAFFFTKQSDGDNSTWIGDWENRGEEFNAQGIVNALPAGFAIYPCSPNPFNPTTTLSFEMRAASFVKLFVYDITGRQIAELVSGWRESGTHEVTFDASDLASGIYIARLQAGDFTAAQKMVLVK